MKQWLFASAIYFDLELAFLQGECSFSGHA